MDESPCSSMLSLPVTRNSLRPGSAQDWERQRETIERLYSTEGRKLREVMEMMERDYGFVATYDFPFLNLTSYQLCYLGEIGELISS